MARATQLSAVGEIVRRHDPDRYLTALFAPPARRETLFTLYAFNHELARAREAVREPMAALIRLQWWREVVEGARRRHEVATPLGEALDEGRLLAADLAGMVEAREAETEPVETRAAFEAYIQGSAGGVMVAAGRALGSDQAEALRPPGSAYGVAGVLRSTAALARQGRCMLPLDLLSAAGLSAAQVIARPEQPGLEPVLSELSMLGLSWLSEPPDVPRSALAALLPSVLARRDLARPGTLAPARSLADRLAVTLTAVRGRV